MSQRVRRATFPGISILEPTVIETSSQTMALIKNPKCCALPYNTQDQSPLFSLPGEIRSLIFKHAIGEQADWTQKWSENTYYTRPGFRMGTRTYTRMLETCQRAYHEAWFLPWTSQTITIFFVRDKHLPHRARRLWEVDTLLEKIHKTYGKEALVLPTVRIFVPVVYPGDWIDVRLLFEGLLTPRVLIFTIRHTDWNEWATDQPLRLPEERIEHFGLPNTIQEVRLELETLDRKSAQLEFLIHEMRATWMFRRVDGTILTMPLDQQASVSRWDGSSCFGAARWLRDETRTAGRLQYEIHTVTFQIGNEQGFEEQHISPALNAADAGFTPLPACKYDSIMAEDLNIRSIPPTLPPSEIRAYLARYQKRCQCQRGSNHNCKDGCREIDSDGVIGFGFVDEDTSPGDKFCALCLAKDCEAFEPPYRRTRRLRTMRRQQEQARAMTDQQDNAEAENDETGYGLLGMFDG